MLKLMHNLKSTATCSTKTYYTGILHYQCFGYYFYFVCFYRWQKEFKLQYTEWTKNGLFFRSLYNPIVLTRKGVPDWSKTGILNIASFKYSLRKFSSIRDNV